MQYIKIRLFQEHLQTRNCLLNIVILPVGIKGMRMENGDKRMNELNNKGCGTIMIIGQEMKNISTHPLHLRSK